MVFDVEKQNGGVECGIEVFGGKKFSRIQLRGDCILQGNLAANSVRSQKPRIATSKLTLQTQDHSEGSRFCRGGNMRSQHGPNPKITFKLS
jgi:hypothetical protein